MGVNHVLSMHPFCVMTQCGFIKRKIIFLSSVSEKDLNRTMKACGCSTITTLDDINQSSLGTCEQFQRIVYDNFGYLTIFFSLNTFHYQSRILTRVNIFQVCPEACSTIIIRGESQSLDETELPSLQNAIKRIRRAINLAKGNIYYIYFKFFLIDLIFLIRSSAISSSMYCIVRLAQRGKSI
jgi:chaperonin GroEL (HSP60 family)